MNDEIWDRDSGNLLIDRPTRVEPLRVVREAIARHGVTYADSLSLICVVVRFMIERSHHPVRNAYHLRREIEVLALYKWTQPATKRAMHGDNCSGQKGSKKTEP